MFVFSILYKIYSLKWFFVLPFFFFCQTYRDQGKEKACRYLWLIFWSLSRTIFWFFFQFNFIAEKDLGFLRIGSLNARVKKTRESFNSFMGGSQKTMHRYPPHYHPHHQHQMMESQKIAAVRSSAPQQQFKLDDNMTMHKSWGSADNIPINVSKLLSFWQMTSNCQMISYGNLLNFY